MVDLKEAEERVILVGVALYDIEEMEHSLEELKELVTTAGAVSLEMFIQSREQIHPGTYLGKGKLDELKEYSPLFDADVYDAISLHTCVDMRSTVGGPSPDAVQAALDDANAWMSKYARD